MKSSLPSNARVEPVSLEGSTKPNVEKNLARLRTGIGQSPDYGNQSYSNPILRGVKDIWVQAGGYVGKPTDGEILTMAQPLNGMMPDSPVDATKPPMPSEWTRTYKSASGKSGRVFTTLYGTPEDLLNDGYRRMLVNGCFWSLGLEDLIKPDANIAFVGPFKPNTFGNGSYARGVKPAMYTDMTSAIPANNNTRDPNPPAKKNETPKPAPKTDKAAKNEAPKDPAAKPGPAPAPTVSGKPARFVRIELPGDKRILTLAEVEVFSAGKNIAKNGKATQSSTFGGAAASRAIDGNKDPEFGKGGQTHTSNSGEKNPWWELDLGQAVDIEKIGVWNRTGFEGRLDGFTLTLLDVERKEVFRAASVAAPQAMEIDVKTGKSTYLTYAGKPGSPVAGGLKLAKDNGKPMGAKKPSEPPQEAGLADVPADYRDPLPFAFKKGDVISILGNGLADRMQHDGWMETLLQSQLVDQQVRFRNMSTSGDRPNKYPRSSGQLSMTAYLQKVKPTVVMMSGMPPAMTIHGATRRSE